jgi:hypothetical protein
MAMSLSMAVDLSISGVKKQVSFQPAAGKPCSAKPGTPLPCPAAGTGARSQHFDKSRAAPDRDGVAEGENDRRPGCGWMKLSGMRPPAREVPGSRSPERPAGGVLSVYRHGTCI